jgi:serine/threonine protein kinase
VNGLDYLNEHQIIHRDIKAENVLDRENETFCLSMLSYFLLFIYFDYVNLADFGISKITKTTNLQSSTINVIGTPLYIAPEIWSEEGFVIFFFFFIKLLLFIISHTSKSDIWSLGVLLYYLMYGIYPFEGKTSETLAVAIVTGKIKTPPEEMQKEYSEGLKKILSLLLSQVYYFLRF